MADMMTLFPKPLALMASEKEDYDDEDDDDYDEGPRDSIKRKVTKPDRGSDGLCKQPDYGAMSDDDRAQREVYENHQRLRASHQLDYADEYTGNTRTFDDDVGDYPCGRCNQMMDGKCLVVVQSDGKTAIKVDLKAGSCRHWENQCAGDPEAWMMYSSIDLSAYAIAKNGEGWGCKRCPYASPASSPDSVGRSLFCGKIDSRVMPDACCAINGAESVPIDADGQPTR